MKPLGRALISLVIFGSLLVFGQNQAHCEEARPCETSVDFVKQIVTVWGLAGIPWESASSYEEEKARAWMDALHHGYEAVLSLPLMEGRQVRNVISISPGMKDRLGMVLLSAPKTFFDPDQTGLVRCRVELPFSGKMSLRSALYLAALRPQSLEPTAFLASWALPLHATQTAGIPGPDVASGEKSLARIVLDLRGTRFEPALFPRFFNEDGRLLFQEATVPKPERFSRPIVRFSQDIRDAYDQIDGERVCLVSALVPPLSHSDVKILDREAEVFSQFCRRILKEPLGKEEILIVYGNRPAFGGVLPKAQVKGKEGETKPAPAAAGKKRR